MTNQEKFLQIFGQDLKRQCSTKSWLEQEYINPQKSGKWIDIEGSNFSKCSECGAETPMYIDPYGNGKGIVVVETSYCPSCGAKMESEEKE